MADNKNLSIGILSYDEVRSVSPALEEYTKGPLMNGLWKRPELSPRDRSFVTVAALIARIQTIEMPFHFALALDNGVKPAELSEVITHLAFYSGWANAMTAVSVAKNVFRERGVSRNNCHPQRTSRFR
ncbi:MAG TPA: carboxymuconolactone decarboxylase family protein [Terracidiphilus sp.]|nr:carboxymuconolactone decarboxylase family protein [Terracidiphilus sp.]